MRLSHVIIRNKLNDELKNALNQRSIKGNVRLLIGESTRINKCEVINVVILYLTLPRRT